MKRVSALRSEAETTPLSGVLSAPDNGARSEPLRDGVPFVQDARNTKSAAQLLYSYINALTAKTDLSLVRLRPYLSLVLDGRG